MSWANWVTVVNRLAIGAAALAVVGLAFVFLGVPGGLIALGAVLGMALTDLHYRLEGSHAPARALVAGGLAGAALGLVGAVGAAVFGLSGSAGAAFTIGGSGFVVQHDQVADAVAQERREEAARRAAATPRPTLPAASAALREAADPMLASDAPSAPPTVPSETRGLTGALTPR